MILKTIFSFFILITLIGCDSKENVTEGTIVDADIKIDELLSKMFEGGLIDDTIHCSTEMLKHQKSLKLGCLKELNFDDTSIIPNISIINSLNNSYNIRVDTFELKIDLNDKNQLNLNREEIIMILGLDSTYNNYLIGKGTIYELEPIFLELFTKKKNSLKHMRYLGRYYEDILQTDSSLKYYFIGSNLGGDRSLYKFWLIHQEEFGVDSTIKKLWEMYHFENQNKVIGSIASIYYNAWVHGGVFGAKIPSDWSEKKMISILRQAGESGHCSSFSKLSLYYNNISIDSTKYYLKKMKQNDCELSEDEISLLLGN